VDDCSYVDISFGCKNEVVQTLCVGIPVSGKVDNAHIWAGEFDGGCNGKRPAMYGVETIDVQVISHFGMLTDSGNYNRLHVVSTPAA
jgi:hypothetical protein